MPVSVSKLLQYKQQAQPITALTAWDYISARIVDLAGVDLVLVGDSLAMVALGHSTTLPLSFEAMLHHAQAVGRGVEQALLVVDLPFMSYQLNTAQALEAAGRMLKESPVQAVKLEGGYPRLVETIAQLVEVGIPVMGHIGLTPQSVRRLGFRQQGKLPTERDRLLREALALEEAGVFAIVLEHIPPDLAQRITQDLKIPTVGIGAGPHCDGQILVTADILGLSDRQPPFAKVQVNLRDIAVKAVQDFNEAVRSQQFPASS
ncbi:MAG: 3-methyl-2-oxobutanoate hydroxymethyltransferase [Cyanobacteria bacterium P01_H01_bin.121]